jgi:glycosyltransferase involved in cell wall biosynthesis
MEDSTNMKLVSIIIPTYNRAKFIFVAIESCLRQTHSEIEILVVDDHSSDETAQVVERYKDPRIKYFRHKDNLGVAAARNTGLRNATGEFIAFLDSDDEWMPEKIAHQVEIFKNSSFGIGLVFTNGYSEYEKNPIINEQSPSKIIYNPKNDNFFPLWELISPPSSWMLPKIVVDEIGYFDEGIHCWDDGDYLVRLALKYPVYFLNKNLVTWHALPEHLNMISHDLIRGKEAFLKKNHGFMKKDKEYLFRFYKTLGKDALLVDKVKSRKYLLAAFLMKPYDLSISSKLFRSFFSGVFFNKISVLCQK